MKKKDKLNYYKFLNSLPKKINQLYFKKFAGKFKLHNKSKKSNGFDPVTNIDKSIEIFLRKKLQKNSPKIELWVKKLK
jgi:Archaeal fructose-1,6-bisphosphatase and related enzymes of inositol monophosphatase family